MKKQKIVIITEYTSFKEVCGDNINKISGFDNLEIQGFLKYEKPELIAVDNLDDTEIIFVWDRYGEENQPLKWWKDFLQKYKKENEKWYVIHHTKGIMPEEQESIVPIQGAHIRNNLVYGNAIAILFDDEKNKKERIIKEVFKSNFEAILEFLHNCLVEKPKNFKNLEDEKIKTDGLPELKGNPNEPDYITSLTNLRDELLKRVQVE